MDQEQRQKRLFKITNMIIACLFVMTGLIVIATTFAEGYGFYGEFGPESGFFPLCTAAIMVLFGIVMIVQTMRGKYFVTGSKFPDRDRAISMALVITVCVVALLLVDILGLTISLFLISFGILMIVYRYKVWYSLLVSAVFIAVIYLVFHVAFSIRFVTGIFGF